MPDIKSIKTKFNIIGNDIQLSNAIETAVKVAETDMSVLVTGESGVGKEVFSRIIHDNSKRKHNKYIAVNCGAIPEGTIESELFGHVKGAFTNADKDRKGYFAVADKGTIFLDEVGELPLSMQVKLLRILQSGEYLPVGSSKTEHCDVRVVAATNVNLLEAIEKGRFREDLYYRLNQITISIPPLRKRKDDIYMLFMRFAVDQAEKYHRPHISLTQDAREYLKNYPWKGNVRQLKNIAEQISVIEEENTIDCLTLQKYIPPVSSTPMIYTNDGEDTEANYDSPSLLSLKKEMEEIKQDVSQLKNVIGAIISKLNPQGTMLLDAAEKESQMPDIISHAHTKLDHLQEKVSAREKSLNDDTDSYREEYIDVEENTPARTMDEIEKQAIIEALKRSNGKRSVAANELGISDRTLYRKIKDYNLE